MSLQKLPYKLGRKPRDVSKPALRFGDIRRKPTLWRKIKRFLRKAFIRPFEAHFLDKFGPWPILGNDVYGDCVSVAIAHDRHKVTSQAGHPVQWTLSQVIELYKTQNPNFPQQDEGMVIQTALDYLRKNKAPDGGELLAFALVDHTNTDEVDDMVDYFGGGIFGMIVYSKNEDQFSNNQPWDYDPSDRVLGGHGVEVGGFSGLLQAVIDFITWTKKCVMTKGYLNGAVEEVWLLFWKEHLTMPFFQQGLDMDSFKAKFEEITHEPFPVVVPPGSGCWLLGGK